MSEGAGEEVGRGSKVSLVCLLDERGMVGGGARSQLGEEESEGDSVSES